MLPEKGKRIGVRSDSSSRRTNRLPSESRRRPQSETELGFECNKVDGPGLVVWARFQTVRSINHCLNNVLQQLTHRTLGEFLGDLCRSITLVEYQFSGGSEDIRLPVKCPRLLGPGG